MSGFLCTMVGATFGVAAAAEVIRSKKGITAVGNAQIDTAQSKFGGSSALFDGSGDYLTGITGEYTFGTSDFTIECWFRYSSLTSFATITDFRFNSGSNTMAIYFDSGVLKVHLDSAVRITSSNSFSANTWYHVALSRSGTSTKLFVDGTQTGSTYTDSTNYSSSNKLAIGANYDFNAVTHWNGHIDEFRISNTARYTANFTPSTTPFVNDQNTLLLLHMDGTDASTYFEDDNGQRAKRSIIAQNSAQIDTAQSKFGGSSALFDGTTDLLITDSTSSFAFGNNQYTIEGWFRLNSTGKQHTLFDIRPVSGNDWVTYVNTSNRIEIFTGSTGTGSTTLSSGVWYHIAIVRDSSNLKVYINGSQEIAIAAPTISNDRQLRIGGGRDGGSFANTDLNGWIDEVRVSNTARYTTTFTPSTTPFVNDTNTLLLLHMDGTDGSTVFDDDVGGRSKKGIAAVGNAQIDTAQSKFGGASALFDGSGDYLFINSSNTSNLNFGTNNFTIEFWVYPTTLGSDFGIITSGTTSFTDSSIGIYGGTSGFPVRLNIYNRTNGYSPFLQDTSATTTNTWTHYAIVRNGNNWTMYKNGSSVSTGTWDGSFDIGRGGLVIGSIGWVLGQSPYGWIGNIDELRISNTARYTANFTPATEPFQNDDNTLLLLHMDGTDGSTVFTDDNGVTPNYNYS